MHEWGGRAWEFCLDLRVQGLERPSGWMVMDDSPPVNVADEGCLVLSGCLSFLSESRKAMLSLGVRGAKGEAEKATSLSSQSATTGR